MIEVRFRLRCLPPACPPWGTPSPGPQVDEGRAFVAQVLLVVISDLTERGTCSGTCAAVL